MKRACLVLSAVGTVVLLSLSCLADNIRVFRRSGYSMVPARYVADWMDATVGYDAAAGELSLTRGDLKFSLKVDSHAATVRGEAVVLPKTPMALDGVTYIPASTLRDYFGIGTVWDAKASALRLTKPWDEGDTDTLVLPLVSEKFYLSDLQLDILNFRTGRAQERMEQGANVGATDSNGMTPLHYAIVLWNLDVAQSLVEHGANVNAAGRAGSTPLHFTIGRTQPYPDLLSTALKLASPAKASLATADSRKTVVGWLLDHGARLEARADGRTPLLLAANVGATEVAQLLLERGADVKARSSAGLTPLHEASAYGNLSIAKLLMQRKADINARDDRGQTPLHLAVGQRQFEAVKWLVASGASVNARTTETAAQGTTAWSGPLSGTSPYSIPCVNVTPLHKAILGIEPASMLSAKGGGLTSAATSYEIARYLITIGKADTTVRAFGGLTPLHYAADSLFVDSKLMQLLLEHTPKGKVNLRTDIGSTALKMAKRRKNTVIAKLIERFGGTE